MWITAEIYLCHFHWNPRSSRVSLDTLGLGNMAQVPGNPKVAANHTARKSVVATFSVLKLSGAIFRPVSCKESVRSFFPYPFLCKPRPYRVNLQSLRQRNMDQVPGNQAKVAANHGARKSVLATFSVLQLSGAIFRPASCKASVRWFSPVHFSANTAITS